MRLEVRVSKREHICRINSLFFYFSNVFYSLVHNLVHNLVFTTEFPVCLLASRTVEVGAGRPIYMMYLLSPLCLPDSFSHRPGADSLSTSYSSSLERRARWAAVRELACSRALGCLP